MNKDSFLLRASFRSFMKKMVLNNLMAFMGSIVNGIVISRYLGLTAMAAFQLTLPLVFVIMIISQIVSLGVQNNCAKSIGAGHQDEAAGFYSTAIACCLPLAALMGFAIFYGAGPLALLLGADGAGAWPEAADYLRGLAPGLALLVFLPMQVAVFFLEGLSKYALWAIVVQTMLNVVGALANVLWAGGGMFGMGVVMSLCYLGSLCVMAAGGHREQGCICFSLKQAKLRHLLPILKIGLPSAADRFYKTAQMYIINLMLVFSGSATSIAAFADLNALNNIFNPIVSGVSAAVLTMAGVLAGEKDKESLHGLLHLSLREALMVEGLTALLAFLAAPLLIALFVSPGQEGYEEAVTALRIFVLYLPLHGLNNLLQKYYLGIQSLKMTYLTSALDNFLYICLLAVVLGRAFGPLGIWWSFLLAEVLTLLTLLLIIGWQKKKWPPGLSDLMCLPPSLAGDIAARSWSAGSMEEVLSASKEASQFLLQQGEKKEKAALLALAIEEMGGNIIRWGFAEGKKHRIDIRAAKGERWVLRIRDNCPPFNPKNWLALHAEDDKTANIGIRTICGLAREVRYSRTLGMNYLFIELN